MAFIVEVTRYVRHSEGPASVEQGNQELAEAETEELTDQAEGFADAIDYTDEDEGGFVIESPDTAGADNDNDDPSRRARGAASGPSCV